MMYSIQSPMVNFAPAILGFPISSLLPRILVSGGLTLGLALAAYGIGAVTAGGAIAGLILTFLICLAAGPSALLVIAAVFTSTFIATKLGHTRKASLGLAEPSRGRTATQIFSNVGAAAFCAIPLLLFVDAPHALLLGSAAALAEAAADTVSSEIGQAYAERAVLITNFRPVETGTNGGVTALGSAAGIVAAIAVTYVAVATGIIYGRWFPHVTLAATIGMFVDSLIGATLENRKKVGNDAVNFASTCASAALALGAWLLLFALR